MLQNRLHIASLAEQERFARDCAQDQSKLQLVFLEGDLGAGKTTFVRFLVKYLGCKEPVSSPTFSLQHIYRLPSGGIVEHWDLYRLKELPIELLEPVPDGNIRVVEWASKFPKQLGEPTMRLRFEFVDGTMNDDCRTVVIEK